MATKTMTNYHAKKRRTTPLELIVNEYLADLRLPNQSERIIKLYRRPGSQAQSPGLRTGAAG